MTAPKGNEKLRVLVVGQTPPPVGGQSIMLEKFLNAHHASLELYHVRMAFSRDMAEVGKLKLSKPFVLLVVIAKVLYLRFRHRIQVLYFPPSPPHKMGMYRDLAILLSVRWCFERTVFHFHAGGISELYDSLSAPLRSLYRWAYFGADGAIRMSTLSPPDGSRLGAKREFIVPNGIEDRFAEREPRARPGVTPDRILYAGVLRESKGIEVLLEACRILRDGGFDFKLRLMGLAQTAYMDRLVERVDSYALEDHVEFLGELSGDAKWNEFADASIFCFPTFFEGEGMPIAVLEAMQFALPVVATRWRGIPSQVLPGETGFLVPIRDPPTVAAKLEALISDHGMAYEMGQRGREVFLREFQLPLHLERLEQALLAAAGRAT